MDLQTRERVLWLIINHLMQMDTGINYAELSLQLPRNELEQMDTEDQLIKFVQVLGLQDIAKELQTDRPLVENYLWR